jgi:integrase
VKFNSDGSLDVTFFGIKNDLQRKGFVVFLPPVANKSVSVFDCLQVYIARTAVQRMTLSDSPLFISLIRPYAPVSASTIGDQMNRAIHLAGLGGQGFTAKSFRPTAATAAISTGCDPDIARKVGRWKSAEVFYDHYVHVKPPATFLDKIFSAD